MRALRWRRRGQQGDDRGMVSLFLGILAASLLLVTGIVVDGGRLLHRYVEAHDLAANAARAAAQAVDVDELYRGGVPRIRLDAAQAAAAAHLARAGSDGAVTSVEVAEGDQVVVEVQLEQGMVMLGGARTITAVASATAQRGVEVPS